MLSHMTSSLLFFFFSGLRELPLAVFGFIATTIDTAKSWQIKRIRF